MKRIHESIFLNIEVKTIKWKFIIQSWYDYDDLNTKQVKKDISFVTNPKHFQFSRLRQEDLSFDMVVTLQGFEPWCFQTPLILHVGHWFLLFSLYPRVLHNDHTPQFGNWFLVFFDLLLWLYCWITMAQMILSCRQTSVTMLLNLITQSTRFSLALSFLCLFEIWICCFLLHFLNINKTFFILISYQKKPSRIFVAKCIVFKIICVDRTD